MNYEQVNKLARRGDKDAKIKAIVSMRPFIAKLAHWAKDSSEYEDIINESLLWAMLNIEDHSEKPKFSLYSFMSYAYLKGAYNVLRTQPDFEVLTDDLDSIDVDQGHSIQILELNDSLENALTPNEKKIIEMYYGLNGRQPLTFIQIGKALNMNRTTASIKLHSALLKLRDVYDS